MLDLKKNMKQDKFLNRRIDNLFSYYDAGNLNTNKIQNILYEFNIQSSLAKKEPTEKPKNKVKVAKVEEPKQEEFKPKKTNQDNEAPVITIAEVITVNDSSYEIEGSVSDNSKNIFVQVDGRTIPVKKGKFKIKRFSPIDEQI